MRLALLSFSYSVDRTTGMKPLGTERLLNGFMAILVEPDALGIHCSIRAALKLSDLSFYSGKSPQYRVVAQNQ